MLIRLPSYWCLCFVALGECNHRPSRCVGALNVVLPRAVLQLLFRQSAQSNGSNRHDAGEIETGSHQIQLVSQHKIKYMLIPFYSGCSNPNL